MAFIPSSEYIKTSIDLERADSRRSFRRNVVLTVLPKLMGGKEKVPSGKTVIEFAFDIAEACVELDAAAWRRDMEVMRK